MPSCTFRRALLFDYLAFSLNIVMSSSSLGKRFSSFLENTSSSFNFTSNTPPVDGINVKFSICCVKLLNRSTASRAAVGKNVHIVQYSILTLYLAIVCFTSFKRKPKKSGKHCCRISLLRGNSDTHVDNAYAPFLVPAAPRTSRPCLSSFLDYYKLTLIFYFTRES